MSFLRLAVEGIVWAAWRPAGQSLGLLLFPQSHSANSLMAGLVLFSVPSSQPDTYSVVGVPYLSVQ